jgi:hypothetical protein
MDTCSNGHDAGFYIIPNSRRAGQRRCRKCQLNAQRRYRATHREKINRLQRGYYADHRDAMKGAVLAWYWWNREGVNARRRARARKARLRSE